MSKTIDFEDAKKPTVLAGTYTLLHSDEYDIITAVQLNGDETIMTTCPNCGREHRMPILDFCRHAVVDFEFFGTTIFCPVCSAVRTNK